MHGVRRHKSHQYATTCGGRTLASSRSCTRRWKSSRSITYGFREGLLQVNEYPWKAEKDGVRYYAAVQGIKLITLVDSGNRETSGGGSILARHFLSKEKWQKHFKEIYGARIYSEIYEALENEYTRYLSDPASYNKQRQLEMGRFNI